MSLSLVKKTSITSHVMRGIHGILFVLFIFFLFPSSAYAAVNIPITVNLSETVNVTGTPRIAVDVGGTPRYATYTSGTGTNALTFTLSPQAGDVDLDGVTVSSPIDLNGGTIKDTKGNNATLTFTPPNTSNVKVNYPSLGMDFVYDADGRYTLNGTAYNDLSSFLTAAGGSFTRASIGTYFDSTGTLQTAASGVPRFDYDPVTHAAKGILIEESRTNILPKSNNFLAPWGYSPGYPTDITTANAAISPDGTMDATTIGYLSPYSTGGRYYSGLAVTSGATYTASIYFKVISGTNVTLRVGTDTSSTQYSRINTSTLAITDFGTAKGAVQNLSNGWYRFYVTFTAPAASIAYIAYLASITSANVVAIYGAQLEAGAFPTSYIPTTSAAVTRAADNLTIPTGGWFNAATGSILAQAVIPYVGSTLYPGLVTLKSGTGNSIHIFMADAASDGRQAEIWVGSNGTFSSAIGSYPQGSSFHGGLAYQANNTIFGVNGSLGALNTSTTLPSITTLGVGINRSGSYLNGTLSKVKYYPARVTDTQLQLLTQ